VPSQDEIDAAWFRACWVALGGRMKIRELADIIGIEGDIDYLIKLEKRFQSS